MRERIGMFFAVVAGIALAIQVALPINWDDHPETSFDTAPRGHAALFELLARFDVGRGRWVAGVTMPPADETVWWIAPSGACDSEWALTAAEAARAPADEEGDLGEDVGSGADEPGPAADLPAAPFAYTVLPWVEAGGTAIVWLSHPPLKEPDPAPTLTEPNPAPVETQEVNYQPAAANADRADEEGGESPNAVPNAAPREGTPSEESDPPDVKSTRESWSESFAESRAAIREGEARTCRGIAGFRLPPRSLSGLEGGELPVDAEFGSFAFSVGRATPPGEDFDYDAAIVLPGPTIAFFDAEDVDAMGWKPIWVEADEMAPLAIERSIGAGRLVVISDARIVTNERLRFVDSAPFAMGWVAEYGVPWIDEHRHGVVPESGTFRYLAGSPAGAACLGFIVFGGLVFWRGRAWPVRDVAEVDPDAPTLASFVTGVGQLYAQTGDHATAFERYRALTLDRLRRSRGLSITASDEAVLAGLRARMGDGLSADEMGLLDLLSEQVVIEDGAALARAAARLDALVEKLNR